jgi:hypothetical protein
LSESVVIRGRNADDWLAVATICRAQGLAFNPFEIPYTADDQVKTALSQVTNPDKGVNLVAELNGQIVGAITMTRGGQGAAAAHGSH